MLFIKFSNVYEKTRAGREKHIAPPSDKPFLHTIEKLVKWETNGGTAVD